MVANSPFGLQANSQQGKAKTMQIEVTNGKYHFLANMLALAHWVLMSIHREPGRAVYRSAKLLHKVFSCGNPEGERELAAYLDPTQLPLLTMGMKGGERWQGWIEDYDEHCFWKELTSRLAEEHLEREYGMEALRALGLQEHFTRLIELADKYAEEFEKNELRNLYVKGFSEDEIDPS
ncbi:MAG: hypothetical protein QHJ34_11595 [bacterium]|jgi:hypothetical protein|nr:hypothetical protein [candidate division KSB1 bacterium]MDH7560857.1 hypothetical protein [bacterium]